MAYTIDRENFFSAVRDAVFGGNLGQSQVDGLDFILDSWEGDGADKDERWLAYVLATAHHETARKMQPIHEFGSDQYFFQMYDIGGRRPGSRAQARQYASQATAFYSTAAALCSSPAAPITSRWKTAMTSI